MTALDTRPEIQFPASAEAATLTLTSSPSPGPTPALRDHPGEADHPWSASAARLTARPAANQLFSHRAVFLAMLAEALASYGMATHELEEAVLRCAGRLNVEARLSATPTTILLMIGPEDSERTRLITPAAAGTNLTRLAQLSSIARRVEAGQTAARDGIEEIRAALATARRASLPADALGSAAVAAAVLVLLGAPRPDLAAGAAVGAIVALTLHVCARSRRLTRLQDFAAAAIAAAAAALIARAAGPIDVFPVTLAGLLPLLPGLSLTIAMAEVAAGSLVAGASRLVGALTVMLSLGFGVAIGYRLAGATDLAIALPVRAEYPLWALAAAVLAAAVALTQAFRARWIDLPVILAAAALATFSARWAGAELGHEFAALVGALTVGLAAVAYERFAGAPAQIPLLPGILLLVPGSIGFRSVHAFMDADALAGAQGVFTMFVTAVGIVTGLLLASILTPTATLACAPDLEEGPGAPGR